MSSLHYWRNHHACHLPSVVEFRKLLRNIGLACWYLNVSIHENCRYILFIYWALICLSLWVWRQTEKSLPAYLPDYTFPYISHTFLTHLPTCRPTVLPIPFLPAYLDTHPPTYHLPTYPPIYPNQPTYLPTHLPSTYLPTYLPLAYPPIYPLPTCLPIY